jgi:hypothetical protein
VKLRDSTGKQILVWHKNMKSSNMDASVGTFQLLQKALGHDQEINVVLVDVQVEYIQKDTERASYKM